MVQAGPTLRVSFYAPPPTRRPDLDMTATSFASETEPPEKSQPEALQLEHDGGQLLKGRQRSDVQSNDLRSSSMISLPKCVAVGGAALLLLGAASTLIKPAPQNVPHATCMGGWPAFHNSSHLAAHSAWSEYIRSIYGSLPTHAAAYPLCTGELWLMYTRELDASSSAALDIPQQVSGCPRDDGSVEGQRYEKHSKLSPPGVTWTWHPSPNGFTALTADTWVEVLHKGGIPDEHVGAWFLTARGTGIWFNLGRTMAFDDHEDAWRHFGVGHLPRDHRNEAMCANATRAGLDSIQFIRHTCEMMYRDCLNTSLPNLTYFNLEVVAPRLQGIHACASADGSSELLRTGWPGAGAEAGEGAVGGDCTCDNNASHHLHCAEVPASVPRELL